MFSLYFTCLSITHFQPLHPEFSTDDTVDYLDSVLSWILTVNLSEEA